MRVKFLKYSSTGNDFIVIDNRSSIVRAENTSIWSKLCHRKTGIGADGVLLVEKSDKADFRMRYINADGGEVSMCGNGLRAISDFAFNELNIIRDNSQLKTYNVETMKGIYEATIGVNSEIRLKMTEIYDYKNIDVADLFEAKDSAYINTGVPHACFEVPTVNPIDMMAIGRELIRDKRFIEGTNFNIYEEIGENSIRVRTYERGVNAETLSCGTGVVACAYHFAKVRNIQGSIRVETLGGTLKVILEKDEVFLCGKTLKIFTGIIDLEFF